MHGFCDIGEVPPHLHKFKTDLERVHESLEKKSELLMAAMMRNFGRTQQDLPNFHLPEIQQSKAQAYTGFFASTNSMLEEGTSPMLGVTG
jgi:hypothetical protein